MYSNSLDGALRTAHSLLDLSPSRSHAPLSVCACHCYSAGDIKALEKCTQLTSVYMTKTEVQGTTGTFFF